MRALPALAALLVLLAGAPARAAVTAAPPPTDTLHITATVPFRGAVETGNAYVDLAPAHTALVNPVIVIEGFDLDNSMGWNELYALLNRENLLETLRGEGFDVVVLDFTDATDWMERNAFVFTQLLQQVEDAIPPQHSVAVVGASMGALVARYGLAWLEFHGIPHRVRTYVSFDGPHLGANLPLGLQYWVQFFSGLSSEAAYLAGRLNTPAAREMLVYHYTQPPATTPGPDSLRAVWLADLAAAGDMPHASRNVAIANGSGLGQDQGFAPGAQLINYDYNVVLVQLHGNVWALPNGGPGTIFDGRQYLFFPPTKSQTVTVSGALPWDDAPGGSRATMEQMDTTAVPYGDIVALHPSHCFVPTVSALAIPTTNPFAPVATDATLRARSPFPVLYVPAQNQEHVQVTAENAAWIRTEIESGVLDAGGAGAPPVAALRAAPRPFQSAVRITFALPRAGAADVTVLDPAGRRVATIASGSFTEGSHAVSWDGTLADGHSAPPGLYFVRLASGGAEQVTRVVRVR